MALHNTRSKGFVPNPISFLDIEAFCRLTGAIISPWELSVILRMDQAVLAVMSKSGGQVAGDAPASEADVQEAKLRIRGAATERRAVKRA